MSREPAPTPRGLAKAAQERELELIRKGKVPDRRGACRIPMHVRPTTDGRTNLVHAISGEIISPCSSLEIAESTKRYFE